MKSKHAAITNVGFVMLLLCFLVICIITPDKETSENENRKLQQMPDLKVINIVNGDFMKEFEVYASDNIFARDEWVRVKNVIDLVLGKKDNGRAYFGKEGYLFPIENIDDNQLEKNMEYVKNFIQRVKNENTNIKASVLIAPTSTEILREKVPKYAFLINQSDLLKKVEQEFGEMFINPTSILLKHKNEYIYYKTDHHWTTLGAYYSYRIWAEQNKLKPIEKNSFKIESINDKFYGTTYSKVAGINTEPDTIQRFSNDSIDRIGMQIVNLKEVKHLNSIYDEKYLDTKDKYAYFLSGNNPLTIINGTPKNGDNILVIKDSYANCFVPFLTEHFENIYVIDLRYYKESISKLIQEKDITDVMFLYNVIQFSNDRNLVYLIKE